jgi:hypothetical protein
MKELARKGSKDAKRESCQHSEVNYEMRERNENRMDGNHHPLRWRHGGVEWGGGGSRKPATGFRSWRKWEEEEPDFFPHHVHPVNPC